MAVKINQDAAAAPLEPRPAAPSVAVASSYTPLEPQALAAADQQPQQAQPQAEEATGADLLGFGKNGEKTYQEIWDNEPGYAIWAMKLHKDLVESGEHTADAWIPGDPKVKRLAQWLQKMEDIAKERGPIIDYDAEMNPVERQSSLTLEVRAEKLKLDSGPKFYGVASPTVGVYKSWEECKPFVIGVKGAKFKSFTSEEEAWEWAKNPPAAAPRKKKEAGEGGEPAAKKQKTRTPEEEEAAEKKRLEAAAKKAEKEKEKAAEKAAKEKEKQDAKAEKSLAKFRETHQKAKEKEDAKAAKESAKQEAKSAKEQEKTSKIEAKQEAKAAKEQEKTAKIEAKEQEKKAKQDAKEAKAAAAAAKKRKAEDSKAESDEAKAEATSPASPAEGSSESVAARVAEVATPMRAEKKAKTTPEKGPAPKPAKGRGKKEEEKKADAPAIDDAILKEAQELKYETALRNLAARPEIVAKGIEARAMLEALKSSEGLVNPAKHALLAQ